MRQSEVFRGPHKRCIGWIRRWAHGPAERAAAKAANYHIMRPGETIALGSANLVCLGPIHVIKAGTEEGGPENRNSLVLRLTHGVNSFLLCGDALGASWSTSTGACRGPCAPWW